MYLMSVEPSLLGLIKKLQMKRHHIQNGFSLISLMMGIIVSMVAIIGLLFSYKNLLANASSVITKASTSSQSSTNAILVARNLQQAGWGVGAAATPPGGAANTDVVLLSSAILSGTTLTGTPVTLSTASASGNALIWDTKINGTLSCSALVLNNGGLTLIGPIACINAAAWSSLIWPLSSQTPLNIPNTFNNANFTAQRTTCWPYGAGLGSQSGLFVTLNGIGSQATAICLSNIPN